MELRVAKRSRCCQGRLPLARVKVASTGLDDGKNCLRETLNPTSDNLYYVRFGQLILAISAHLRTFALRVPRKPRLKIWRPWDAVGVSSHETLAVAHGKP